MASMMADQCSTAPDRGITRRGLIAGSAALLLAAPARAAGHRRLELVKTAGCGCCIAWIRHVEAAGFEVASRDVASGEMARIKIRAGITPELASCHTAFVAGYVIEGHVPAADVARLLAERPDGLGLAVPGMPIGSPGMESGDRIEPYAVLLIRRDGATEVFSSHP